MQMQQSNKMYIKGKSAFRTIVQKALAEREGFEPPVPLGTPVFKTGVIDHSTISPLRLDKCRYFSFCVCKGTTIILFPQDIPHFFALFYIIRSKRRAKRGRFAYYSHYQPFRRVTP